MATVNISPNMNMPVPVVGQDPGPDWATNIVASLSVVDSHNHTTGQGVPITPQGLNINADLPLNGNNLTTARSVRFTPQTGTIVEASDLGCLYENGVDLYYVDGAGNQVRITQGGSVTGATGTITGLPSGTASASFAGNTFTFQSATNTPAAMNFGPVTLGQAVASGKSVTISASGSQPANYNLTLPISLPAGNAVATIDASGNMGTIYSATASNETSFTFSLVPTSLGTIATQSYSGKVGNYFSVSANLSLNFRNNNGSPITPSFTITVTDGSITLYQKVFSFLYAASSGTIPVTCNFVATVPNNTGNFVVTFVDTESDGGVHDLAVASCSSSVSRLQIT